MDPKKIEPRFSPLESAKAASGNSSRNWSRQTAVAPQELPNFGESGYLEGRRGIALMRLVQRYVQTVQVSLKLQILVDFV